MRILGSTLEAAQRKMGDAICKVVLADTYTYDISSTTNRILDLRHPESEWSQTAQIKIDNREGNLTALTLEGDAGIVSYGFGSTDSACAPLTVIAQKTDSLQGELVTTLSLAGLFNMWAEQEATVAYTPDEINTDTVKTILDAIAAPSLACFSETGKTYPAHTIAYDDDYDDGIINSFKPADNFSVAKGESRLSAFKKALAWTKCKCRVENDSSVATIHIFQHETTTLDYEYNDAIAITNHNFFDKSVRKRLVLPNKVVVMNHPEHIDEYSGTATDDATYAALGYYITKTVYCRPADNTQAALIAAGILLKYQLAAEKGHGIAPMNCGQEYCDYVKITDSRAADDRTGNIGYLNRWYSFYSKSPTRFGMEFRFGTLEMLGLAGTIPPAITTVVKPGEDRSYQGLYDQVEMLTERYNSLLTNVRANREALIVMTDWLNNVQWDNEVWSLSVLGRLQIPHGTNMYT